MKQYRYNGLDIVEDDHLIWIKNLRDEKLYFQSKMEKLFIITMKNF